MIEELLILIEKLNDPKLKKSDVITWGSPIISFGNLSNSRIATLGLNPSNKEFVNNKGEELTGNHRRFHTLKSLDIKKWSDVEEKHLQLIYELCEEYFFRNPYVGWFKKLDYLISGTLMSYYFPSGKVCHLDLIPYATESKWTNLSTEQKKLLFKISGDALGVILKHSPIQILVLNGQSVVNTLEKVTKIEFKKTHMPKWTLPRKLTVGVAGYSYTGIIDSIGEIKLKQNITVLGYNHNIQSSFGVTFEVQKAIRNWITEKTKEVFQ